MTESSEVFMYILSIKYTNFVYRITSSWACTHEIEAINLLNVSLSDLVPMLNVNKLPF